MLTRHASVTAMYLRCWDTSVRQTRCVSLGLQIALPNTLSKICPRSAEPATTLSTTIASNNISMESRARLTCAPWYAPNELPPEVAGVQGKDSEANNLPGPEREGGQEPVVEARNDRRCV